jgi:mono/diheme cytochrome c family protein
MSRSFFLVGALLVVIALLAGGLVSAGLYRWEQTTRPASQVAAAPPIGPSSPANSAASPTTPAGTPEIPAGARQADGATSTPVDGTTAEPALSAAKGRSVYTQLCDACHPGGSAGLGPALTGPAFTAAYGDDAALAAIIRQGTARMPAFPASRISDEQLNELIAFIRALGAASQAGGATPTELPVLGQMTWTGSYARDIQPIFNEYCVRCHGEALAESGLRLDSYQGVMQGTRGGPVVTPGIASGSTLVWVIQGLAAPEIRMPHADRPLSPNRIQNIILWIDAGAPEN